MLSQHMIVWRLHRTLTFDYNHHDLLLALTAIQNESHLLDSRDIVVVSSNKVILFCEKLVD